MDISFRRSLARQLLCAFLVLGTCGAVAAPSSWKLTRPRVSFTTPQGFSKAAGSVSAAALELYDPSRNMMLLVSPGGEEKISMPRYLEDFPAMLKARGGTVLSRTPLKVAGDPAAMFVVSGLVPEPVESIYVYVAPAKGEAYSLVLNYPATQRKAAASLLEELLRGLRPGR